VWLLVVGLVLCELYATRVVGPKVVPAGEPILTKVQRRCWWAAIITLWIAADWPMHDWAEDYLYSVHMVQHLLLTMVIPPLVLLATPVWLARLVLGPDSSHLAYRIYRRLTRPLIAGLLYAAVFALGHWPSVVDLQTRSEPFHFGYHVLYVLTSLLMWSCVCGPLKELRISVPAQIGYLFLLSIPPTVPGGWLVFADKPVYKAYVHPFDAFGMGATTDQQLAGFIMKVVGGLFLWLLIFVLFFRWHNEQAVVEDERRRREDEEFWAGVEAAVAFGVAPRHRPKGELTFEEVQAEFDRSGAPAEQPPR
jgi:putative membrane protein